jgi:hypothetical protein
VESGAFARMLLHPVYFTFTAPLLLAFRQFSEYLTKLDQWPQRPRSWVWQKYSFHDFEVSSSAKSKGSSMALPSRQTSFTLLNSAQPATFAATPILHRP